LAPSGVEAVRSRVTIDNGKTFVVISVTNGTSTVYGLKDFGMRTWERLLVCFTEASTTLAYNTVYVPTDNNIYVLNPENETVKCNRTL
jgi:hypothetical protein